MCVFSKFKDALGVAGQGFHEARLLKTAMYDYIGSILLALLLTLLYSQIPLVVSTVSVLVLGEILHYLFGVQSQTMKFLGLTCNK
jgi:hypothetical protein